MKKKIIGLSIVIILIGIIMVFIKGFKVNLKYRDHKMVKLSIGQECNIKEFNKIAKDVLGKQDFNVEKAGLYGDRIREQMDELGSDISDEQIDSLIKKVEEKFNVTQSIVVPIGKEYEISDIESIVKEVTGKDNVKVEKYDKDETSVNIESGLIRESVKNNLVEAINEKYEIENAASSVYLTKEVVTYEIGRVTLMDFAKQYISYVAIATIFVLVYFIIRYRKQGIANVLGKSILVLALSELLYAAIIAIVRYPIDKMIIIGSIAIYMLVLTYLNKIFMDAKDQKSK